MTISKKKLPAVLHTAIFVIGVLLIIVGFQVVEYIGILISTLGTTILGASISLAIDAYKKKNEQEESENSMSEILTILKNSFKEDVIKSNDRDIHNFKQKLYLYYLTTSEKRVKFWNSYVIDFSHQKSFGILNTDVTINNYAGKPYKYKIEALKRGETHPLIIIHTAQESHESNGVYIFPPNLDFDYYGFQYHSDWLPEAAISPAILMTRLETGCTDVGRVPEDIAADLQKKWEENFKAKCFQKYV